MASIDLPRALQDYFAFAETTPTRAGRRFSITMPYLGSDGRLDRLQWWYHLPEAKEKALGDTALEGLRALAIERFRMHIDRWLHNTAQVLYGDGPIPHVASKAHYRTGTRCSAPGQDLGTGDAHAAEAAAGQEPGVAASAEAADTSGTPDLRESADRAQDEPALRLAGKSAFG